MDLKSENDALIISFQNSSTEQMAKTLNERYYELEDRNVILDLQNFKSITLGNLIELLQISNRHREAHNSFVILNEFMNIDEVPDELVLVPTMQEAFDIIEMENIERDLGF